MKESGTNKRHRDPRRTEDKLRSIEVLAISAGIHPSKFLPLIRKELAAAPDPERALNNFLRFISTGFTSSILGEFFNHPAHLHVAMTLFSHSQYLSDILVRNPELFHWLTSTNALSDAKPRDLVRAEASNAAAPFERVEKKIDALKRFHRRELLRISARDILKHAPLETVTQELSWLADSIVEAVLRIGEDDLKKRVGRIPQSTLAVIGLGKLGGEELNFSSDIDLMFVYDRDEKFSAPQERIHSTHEYVCRLAEFVVRKLTERTEEGYLYRVDMRLRPDGGSGPLALSREGYRRYYETRGELWERQMLLKARVVAGDEVVGAAWQQDIRPFVYPTTILRDPFQEIADIKSRIESRIGDEENIKLSKGGIRDIEFIVQALQLLRSGVDAGLRERNTLNAIAKLSHASLLRKSEGARLARAYRLFREIEHRLQLLHGSQTHELPGGKEDLRLLGKRLGFASKADFERHRKKTQNQVRTIFDSVFRLRSDWRKQSDGTKNSTNLDVQQILHEAGFLDGAGAVRILETLKKSSPAVGGEHRRQLIRRCGMTGAPDWALKNMQTLLGARSMQRTLELTLANDRIADLLVAVAGASSRITQHLAREPLLFETLLGRPDEFLRPGIEWRFLLGSDLLRFRIFNECKAAIRFILGKSTIEETTKEVSDVADTILHAAVTEVSAQHRDMDERFLLMALGKYGGREILMGSDLDLMILYEQPPKRDRSHDFETLAKNLVKAFSSSAGIVYDIDLRLRPEGRNAPLSTELSYFEKYLDGRAALWEKQALLRARSVFGGNEITKKVLALRSSVLENVSQAKSWVSGIEDMRGKMEVERTTEKTRNSDLKVGKGGLVDIEFVVQSLQLAHLKLYDDIDHPNTMEAIASLADHDLLSKTAAKALIENYRFLRQLEFWIRLNSDRNEFRLPDNAHVGQAIASRMAVRSLEELTKRIEIVRKENHARMLTHFAHLKIQ